jgi:ribosomal protein S18 acetylase RimI-like enzyme
MELVSYRPAKTSDLPYIFNSMLKAMRVYFPHLRTSAFFDAYKPKVQRLVGESNIQVACFEKDQDLIYGYVIYSMIDDILVLHWVNVKKPFRRMGIAKELLKSIGKDQDSAAFATWEYKIKEVTDKNLIKFKKELQTAAYK